MILADHPQLAAPASAGQFDVILLSKEGHFFYAHQRYLATNSVFFEQMLVQENTLTSTEGPPIIQMEESAMVMNVLLHHFYPSCSFPMAELSFEEMMDCLRGADKLENPRAIQSITNALLRT